jgi:chemotaxis protein methyltransferase CheR
MNLEMSPIDQADIESFFNLVEKNIGITLDLSKAYLIQSRLSNIVREYSFTDHSSLLRHLIINPVGKIHWQAFEAMTTNETSFYRDSSPFEVLKTTILPDLIQKHKDSRELNIWSAASSTGQEPYSIAMLLREHFPELGGWNIRILATDISEQALEKASLGIYNQTEVQRGLTETQIQRQFKKLPNGHYEISADLRSMVQFKQMNLIQEWPLMPKFDLILIRNVLIYFNQDTKAKIVKRIYTQLLDASAYLILGSSESILFDQTYQIVQLDRVSYYQKKII